ncbi:hypothetical protein ACR9GP_25245 [Enterobacter ludwigii]
MKLINGPILCPHCGSLSAYYEIDRLSAKRDKTSEDEIVAEWSELLKSHKKKVLCLMCHKAITQAEEGTQKKSI